MCAWNMFSDKLPFRPVLTPTKILQGFQQRFCGNQKKFCIVFHTKSVAGTYFYQVYDRLSWDCDEWEKK